MLDSEQEERWNDPLLQKQGVMLITSKEKRNKRMLLCKECDNLKFLFCKLCSCYMPGKTWLEKESCPDLKW